MGVTAVQASGAEIAESVDTIRLAALNFSAAVTNWDGKLQTTRPISDAAVIAFNGLVDARRVADESKKMSVREALVVKQAFYRLIDNVTSTVDLVVETRPKFTEAWLKGSVLLGLRKSQDVAGMFTVSVLNIVPLTGKKLGKKLGRQLNDEITRGVDAYNDNF